MSRSVAAAILLMFAATLPVLASIGPSVDDVSAVRPARSSVIGPTMLEPGRAELNPFDLMQGASSLLTQPSARTPNAPEGPAPISGPVSILVLLTVVTLAPSIMLMTTCFMRIIIVLGLLRQALGTQSIPPPQVVTALALFMTLVVMSPTIERINAEAIVPYRAGEVTDHGELWDRAKAPVRDFMLAQIEATGNWSSVYMVMSCRGQDTSRPETIDPRTVDMVTLVPAFMLSELKTAFLMGFRIYLPFLVIDLVVSALLISMSMMMVPPVMVSLPFKLLLFVLVDGWQLVAGSLMSSFAGGGGS